MINVKFSVGNKILKIGRWFTGIFMFLHALAGLTCFILSFALADQGRFLWGFFYAGIGNFVIIIFLWILRYFIYGFGLMVCNSAYQLSQKRAFTYLDFIEAERQYKNHKIDINQMNKFSTEYYSHEAGYIEKDK